MSRCLFQPLHIGTDDGMKKSCLRAATSETDTQSGTVGARRELLPDLLILLKAGRDNKNMRVNNWSKERSKNISH